MHKPAIRFSDVLSRFKHTVLNDEVSSLSAWGMLPSDTGKVKIAWHLYDRLYLVARHQAQEIIALAETEIRPISSTFGQALAKTKTCTAAIDRASSPDPVLANSFSHEVTGGRFYQ